MKRLLVTILSILYLASATGATVHIHYCMGKMMSKSLHSSTNDRCGRCGMKKAEEKKGCCKDEQETVKASDHQIAKSLFVLLHTPFVYPTISYSVFCIHQYEADEIGNIAHANSPPPGWQTCPIYLWVQNFRI